MILSSRGLRVGFRLFPGSFLSLFGEPALPWRDRSEPLGKLVGTVAAIMLQNGLTRATDGDEALAVLRAWLAPRIPSTPKSRAELAIQACQIISDNTEIFTVSDLARKLGCSESTLQRVFNTHVGLNPKWVLRCKRFQEAVGKTLRGVEIPWSNFALNLGYFDQAHFIRDFKQLTGKTPTEWTPMT